MKTLWSRRSPRPSKTHILAGSIALLLAVLPARATETFTYSGVTVSFTYPLAWDFGAGPVPASDASLALNFQIYGTNATEAANDLNLTINTINLATYATAALTLSDNDTNGNYAFTGGAGTINLLGSGATTTLSAGVVLAPGLTSLTIDGAGPSGLTINGLISSNNSTGAPLIISADAVNAGTGVVTLNGTNTFAGGVVLNSGTLALNDDRALGDRANTLTINGGNLRAGEAVTIGNNIILNSTLNLNAAISNGLTLSGVISGAGANGLLISGAATRAGANLSGTNTYTGATTIRGLDYAAAAVDGAGGISVVGAAGSIMNTSAINISEGGNVNLNYGVGNSAANTRVSTSTVISITGGFLNVSGSTRTVRQSLGTVNAGGLTSLEAVLVAGTNANIETTIANLNRTAGATVAFSGANLGRAAIGAGSPTGQSNFMLTQINGGAVSAALVGGTGSAGSAQLKIIPWALGDANTSTLKYDSGSGFVTYDTNGVRLLDTTTEYNITNNVTAAGATDNVRISASHALTAGTTVNSLFFGTTGATISGSPNVLTITSGALASNVAAATISAPVSFGPAGAGEGIVSVVGTLSTTNAMTLSGTITAASLVKSGHGQLVLSGSGNAIAGGITVNGGDISVGTVTQLGGATSYTFYGQSYAADRAGLTFTHSSGTQTLTAPVFTQGGMTSFNVTTAAATLALNSDISGAGGVRYDGAGNKIPGGTNSYTGGTYLGAGTLQLSSDAKLGDATNPLANFLGLAGGTLQLTGTWTSARAISVDGDTVLNTQANNATLSGPITGASALTKLGTGTLSITGADNGYTGTLIIGGSTAGGILAITGAGGLNSAKVTFGAASGPSGTYTLDLSGATDTDTSDGSSTPWRSLVSLNTTSSFNQAHTVQLGLTAPAAVDLRVNDGTFGRTAGVIAGFGKLVKAGPGTLTLNGTTASTFTGAVEIWGGTLQISADNQLGDSGNDLAIAGGELLATASVASARDITLAPTPLPIIGTATFLLSNKLSANSTFTLTLSGVISGPGGFSKTGLGTVALTGAGANNYLGDTSVSAGALSFTRNDQLGDTVTSRLRLQSGTLQDAASSGTQTLNRTVFITNAPTIDVSSGATLELSGPINGIGVTTLTKTGAGALIISGNNPFFGTLNVGNGSAATGGVTLTGSGQLRRAGLSLAASSGATFSMSGLAREFGSVTTLASGTTLALGTGGSLTTGFNNTAMTWSGNITGTGAAFVTKTGTGTLTIQGNGHTFGGGFHFLGSGGITLSGNGTLPAQSAFTLGAWGSSNANAGPVFLLDNTGTNLGTRLDNAQIIHSNTGTFQFSTNTTTATSETIGSLRGAGMTTVLMTTGGTLNFGDATTGLTRSNRGTFQFLTAGTGTLGSAGASTTTANVTFGNSGSLGLIGSGGIAGTTTISILPYAVGKDGGGAADYTFVTYGPNGIRTLQTSANEYRTTLPGAGATENVNLVSNSNTTVTLSGGTDQTINALMISGLAFTRIESAATEKLIVGSGLVVKASFSPSVYATNTAGTIGSAQGIQTAELQTGAGNTRELNLFTPGDLALGAKVTTSGGLTKSGTGTLYLSNSTNTYTGATTVNAGNLVVDNLAALGGSTSLVIGGGFFKYRGTNATLTGFSVVAAGGEAANPNGGSAGFHVVSGTTLALASSAVSGFGGLLKDGTGVLELHGTNTYSGATIISGGALAIDNPNALGTNSRIIFGDGLSANGGQTLRFTAPMTLTQDFIVNSGQAGIGFGFDTNGNDVTLSGTILDARSSNIRGLYKFGAGELNLTATEMYTGPTQVFGGTLRLSGANGSIVNDTGGAGFNLNGGVVISPGTALVLDNSVTNNNNRLPDTWDSSIGQMHSLSSKMRMNGGELKILGHATGTSERVNSFDFFTGTVTLSGGGTTLTSSIFTPTSTLGAGLIRGTNLGALPGAASTNWFLSGVGGEIVQLDGAGSAEGTAYVSILRGFMSAGGATGATDTGSDFVTYAGDTGFRPLTAGEYTSTIPSGNFDLHRAPNVSLAGAAQVTLTTAITALKLGPGASVGGSGTLLLSQSTAMATGNAAINVTTLSSNITGSNAGYVFLTSGGATTLTVGSTLPSAGLTTYGEGTLALNGRYLGAGALTVAQGTLRLNSAAAGLNPLGSLLNVLPGATFELGGTNRMISGLTNTAGLSTSNMEQAGNGTVALGANRLTLYDSTNTTFSGAITGSGDVTKAFFSTGTSIFTRPLSYTGSTVIRAGTFRLDGAGTLASTSVEIRGGTLNMDNDDENAATGGYIANRIGSGTPVTLAGGGLSFTENANTPANHNLGAVTLAGGGTLTIGQPSVTAPSTTTIANLIRGGSNSGTLNISATSLGLALSPTGNARIFATQINGAAPASAFIGAGGAVDTMTQNILPWAWSSTASSFLTYGADGFRPLATASEYATTLGANATDNVRTTAAAVLSAPITANSLIHTSTGSISGAFDLTLTSGVLAVSGASTIGVNTNALLTGAGNTRELVINATAALDLPYNLTTSGGVTKFGTSALTLSGTGNTFAGGLAINQGTVNFSNDNQLGATGGAVRLGGTTLNPAILTYTGSGTLVFNRPVETTSFGQFTGVANQRWQFNQPITGAGGIRYSTANAIFELNVANTYTGATQLTSGIVYANGDSAFGNGGEVLFSGGTLAQRGDWNTSRLVHISSASTIHTNGFDATLAGTLIGSSAFTKTGNGNLIVTEAMPYAGALTVNAGTVVLKDRGSIAANSGNHAINAGAALTLDDTGIHTSDRLHDSSGSLTVTGGEFKLLGNGSVTTEEVMRSLFLGTSGASILTITPGSGQAAILRISATLQVNNGASLWRGTNLGVNAPGAANGATVILTENNDLQQGGLANVTFLTGGEAPAGSPSVSTIKGGFGDTSATGLGTQLVTYDFDKGIRLLNPTTEYTTTLVGGTLVTDNVKADGSALTLASATTANALWLKDGGSVTGAGALTLTAGTLLVTGTGNTVSTSIAAGSGNVAFAVGGPGNVTFNNAITSSGSTGGLIKMGAGTLTLNVANSYLGATVLAAGTVAVGDAGAFGSNSVQFQGGAIQNATAGPLTLANNLILNGPMIVSGTRDLEFGGTVSLANATREISVTGTGIATLSGVISSSTANLNYGLTKTGPGTLVLAHSGNTYDGATTVSQGTLLVSGSISGSATTVTNAGSTLGGAGIVGDVSVASGAILQGGDGNTPSGALNSGGTVSLLDGSVIKLTLGASATHSSLGRTGGLWSFDSNQAFAFTIALGASGSTTYDNVINGLSGSEAGLATIGTWLITTPGVTGTFTYDGAGGVDLAVSAIPEPGTAALLLTALPLLAWRRRRR